MPLDPFFADRLRVHRRHLHERALASARGAPRLALWPFGPPAVPAAAPPPPAADGHVPPRETARAHEPAPARGTASRALKWDRTRSSRPSGPPGPDIPIAEHMVAADGFPSFRVRIYYPTEPDGTLVPGVPDLLRGRVPHRRDRLPLDGCRLPAACRRFGRRDGRGRLRPRTRAPYPTPGGAGLCRSGVALRAGGRASASTRSASGSWGRRRAATSRRR